MSNKLSLGARIDALRAFDLRIAKARSVLQDLSRQRDKLEKKLMRAFALESLDGAKGKLGQCTTKTSKYPSISNRRKFDVYVSKHKAFDLYQSRVNSRAYFDRIEEGATIPGVSVFEKTKLHVTKRK